MSFSLLKKIDTKTKIITPLGLDQRKTNVNYMAETLNLEYGDRCFVRAARKLALPFEKEPDQIINCGDRVFLRYINNIKELIKKDKDFTLGEQIGLLPLSGAPDRTIVAFEDKIYIFPDQLVYEERTEPWIEFATNDAIPIKFPFVGAYGLFFTNGYDGNDVCSDVGLLKVGCEIKFSWNSEKNFKVVKKEEVYASEEGLLINVGTVFWLNAPVRSYNVIPEKAFALVRYPKIYKSPQTIYLGYGSRGVEFFGNSLSFSRFSGTRIYTDPDIANTLFPGMRVKIEGASIESNNGKATITHINDSAIVFDKTFEEEALANDCFIKITPIIPKTDHTLVIDNRLFIADNEGKILTASRSGQPLIFCGNEVDENGSFELPLSKPCTGLTEFKNQLHCFTVDGGFKLYESKPEKYFATNLQVGGIPMSSSKTLCNIKDSLLYFSDGSVMKYNGGSDSTISKEVTLFDPKFAAAVKGKYYILDGDNVFVYFIDGDKWWAESGDGIKSVFLMENQVYFVKKEGIYVADGSSYTLDWSLCSCELPGDNYQKVLPIGLKLFLSSQKGCELSAMVRLRGESLYKNVFTGFVKDEGVINIPLGATWNDGFYLKLSGRGDAVIEKLIIKYRSRDI